MGHLGERQGRRAQHRRTAGGQGASRTRRQDRERRSGQRGRNVYCRIASGAHEYIQAQDFQAAGKYEDALGGYKKAIALDKQFGRAYAGLGAVSNSLGRREGGRYYKQALDLINRMTDRESSGTRGGYYLLIRDLDKAREQFHDRHSQT